MGPERADLGSERADLGPERGLGGTDVRTDGRLEIHPCVPLPKKYSFLKNFHLKRTHRWPTWPCFSKLILVNFNSDGKPAPPGCPQPAAAADEGDGEAIRSWLSGCKDRKSFSLYVPQFKH